MARLLNMLHDSCCCQCFFLNIKVLNIFFQIISVDYLLCFIALPKYDLKSFPRFPLRDFGCFTSHGSFEVFPEAWIDRIQCRPQCGKRNLGGKVVAVTGSRETRGELYSTNEVRERQSEGIYHPAQDWKTHLRDASRRVASSTSLPLLPLDVSTGGVPACSKQCRSLLLRFPSTSHLIRRQLRSSSSLSSPSRSRILLLPSCCPWQSSVHTW